MDRFGSDRPDLRFGLELHDVSDAFCETEFRAFAQTLDRAAARSRRSLSPAVPGTRGVKLMNSPMSRLVPARKDLPPSRSKRMASARLLPSS